MQLQLLSYEPSNRAVDLAYTAKLTALTKLEIRRVLLNGSENFGRLSKLWLKELRLVDCYLMAEALLQQGSFPVLQKLHILECKEVQAFNEAHQELGVQVAAPQVQELKDVVFGLPCLTEMSGICRLFLLDMPETWRLLTKEGPVHFLGSNSSRTKEQIWRKIA